MYIIIKLNYYQDKAEKRGVFGKKKMWEIHTKK